MSQDFSSQQNSFQRDQAPKKSGNPWLFCCLIGCGGLLLVVVVLAVLSFILLPKMLQQGFKQVSNLMVQQQEIAIMQAMKQYHDVHKSFPPAFTVDKDGKPLHSWRVLLVPYLPNIQPEQREALRKIKLDEPWDSDFNKQFHSKMPQTYFALPEIKGFSDPQMQKIDVSKTSFKWIVGPDKISDGPGCTKLEEVSKDHSKIIVLIEVKTKTNWMQPDDVTPEELKSIYAPQNPADDEIVVHEGGAACGKLDGTVEALSAKLTPEEWEEQSKIK